MIQEISDKSVNMILFDVVLGYGSHTDMAGEMVEAINKGKKASGNNPVMAACICGTQDDMQGYSNQATKLEDAGVIVFPTNVAMVKFAQKCLERK